MTEHMMPITQEDTKSSIAQFLQAWDQEVDAMRHGFKGFAVSANHEAINARMNAAGARLMPQLNAIERTGQEST